MHSSLVVTPRGLPLGLAAVKFWTRKKFRGTAALKRKINGTRVPIEKKESVRWLENLRSSIDCLGQPERCTPTSGQGRGAGTSEPRSRHAFGNGGVGAACRSSQGEKTPCPRS